jgi:hypothetical protein
MENCGGHAVLLSWFSDLADVVAQGKIQDIAIFADGRARVVIDYRSLKAARSFVRGVDALSAMIAEDAAARLDVPNGSDRE